MKKDITIKHLMKTISAFMILLCVISCGKPPSCTTGKDHDWGKWEKSDLRTFNMDEVLVKTCKECGWRQKKISFNE